MHACFFIHNAYTIMASHYQRFFPYSFLYNKQGHVTVLYFLYTIIEYYLNKLDHKKKKFIN